MYYVHIYARQQNILTLMTQFQCDTVNLSMIVAQPLQIQEESQTTAAGIPLYVNVPTLNAALTPPVEPLELLDVDSEENLLLSPIITFKTDFGLLERDGDIDLLSNAEAALEANNDHQIGRIHAV